MVIFPVRVSTRNDRLLRVLSRSPESKYECGRSRTSDPVYFAYRMSQGEVTGREAA